MDFRTIEVMSFPKGKASTAVRSAAPHAYEHAAGQNEERALHHCCPVRSRREPGLRQLRAVQRTEPRIVRVVLGRGCPLWLIRRLLHGIWALVRR